MDSPGLIDRGKRSILGVRVNVIDYEGATKRLVGAAASGIPVAATALAVHGVMTGRQDAVQRYRLNHLDMVLPDGQPVRWALALVHGERLPGRVDGPNLMLHVCEKAAEESLPIFLYGSTAHVLDRLTAALSKNFPKLQIAGVMPSHFRRLTDEENDRVLETIKRSGARITFVGLGCPRQEVWAFDNTQSLGMPVLAVGAAFDMHAGLQARAPDWMQRSGLEWLYRLMSEPRRLWRRYLLLNPLFCWNLAAQLFRPERFEDDIGMRPAARTNVG